MKRVFLWNSLHSVPQWVFERCRGFLPAAGRPARRQAGIYQARRVGQGRRGGQARAFSGRINPTPTSPDSREPRGIRAIQALLPELARFGCAALLFCLTLACAEKAEEEGNFTALDDRGVEVTFSRAPERVVSLVPSITEAIFALGAEAKLVGVTTFCNHPPQASEKPKVGDFSNPSLERIVGLKPEVVFATMPEQTLVIRRLEDLRLRVFSLQPESVEGTLRSLEKLGAILARQARADSLVNQLRKELASISDELRHIEGRRVYVEIASNPVMAATESSFVGELVAFAGGTNIARGAKPYIVVNSERIIKEDPQVIVITHPASTVEEVRARIGWQRISAVRENRIYQVNPDLVLRPGPRMVKGVIELLEAIHPEVVGEESK